MVPPHRSYWVQCVMVWLGIGNSHHSAGPGNTYILRHISNHNTLMPNQHLILPFVLLLNRNIYKLKNTNWQNVQEWCFEFNAHITGSFDSGPHFTVPLGWTIEIYWNAELNSKSVTSQWLTSKTQQQEVRHKNTDTNDIIRDLPDGHSELRETVEIKMIHHLSKNLPAGHTIHDLSTKGESENTLTHTHDAIQNVKQQQQMKMMAMMKMILKCTFHHTFTNLCSIS